MLFARAKKTGDRMKLHIFGIFSRSYDPFNLVGLEGTSGSNSQYTRWRELPDYGDFTFTFHSSLSTHERIFLYV